MVSLLEYNYLVKKVVFKISILPIIKIIAATFIHAFFVLVLLIVAALNGYYPSLYTLQVFYYSFCMFVFVLALSYTPARLLSFSGSAVHCQYLSAGRYVGNSGAVEYQ